MEAHMKETIHCLVCNAILGKIDLGRLKHVEIRCAECGEWSQFDYDPVNYVMKALDD